jgi:hypothetical protein
VIASYHLGPLSSEECRSYIEHRLRCVGWVAEPQFDEAAYEAIFAATDGTPRRINTLCDRLLLAGMLAEKKQLTEHDVHTVVAELGDEEARSAPRAGQADSGELATLLSRDQEDRLSRMEARLADVLRLLRDQHRAPTSLSSEVSS